MKLWLLRPILKKEDSPWRRLYDMSFGFVILAESEERARAIAHESSGEESKVVDNPWLDSNFTICVELKPELHEQEDVVMMDFYPR